MQVEGTKSYISKNTTTGYADTTVAQLYGSVVDDDTIPCPYAIIVLFDTIHHKHKKVQADSAGHFSMQIDSGIYKLQVRMVGQANFDSTITLRSGEIRELEIVMGSGGGFVTYVIESKRRLNFIRRKKRFRKIAEEENNNH